MAAEKQPLTAINLENLYNEQEILGEYPQNVPGEIVVTTNEVVSNDAFIAYELTEGEPSRVSKALQIKGKAVGAVVRGSRKIALYVGDHPGVIGAAAGVIAGTFLFKEVVVPIAKKRKER